MTGFRLTPRAAHDLDAIALWTLRQWGAARMEDYLRRLNDRFHWLALNPLAGRARDDIHADYRSVSESQHVVFHVIKDGTVTIIGIPHLAVDIGSLFP